MTNHSSKNATRLASGAVIAYVPARQSLLNAYALANVTLGEALYALDLVVNKMNVPGLTGQRAFAIDVLKRAEQSETQTPEPTAAARDVLAERQRQVETERWSHEHDDNYTDGELAKAAAGYAMHAHADQVWKKYHLPDGWPWHPTWFKAREPRHMLVKAGALILAEIERLDRAEPKPAERTAEKTVSSHDNSLLD